MLRLVSWFCRRPLGLAAILFGLLACGSARAQSPDDGMDVLTNKFNRKLQKQVEEYFKSQVALDATDTQLKEAVDLAAQWVTYRLHTEVWISMRDRGAIYKLFGEFEHYLKLLQANKDNPELAKLFAQRVLVRAMETIHVIKARPITQVNAARILAGLAPLRQGELSEKLLELLKDPKMNDGVKYWCLRGLRNLLALPVVANTTPVLSKDQMSRIVSALIEFTQREPVFSSAPSIEEVDGFRLLRREAVRALAEVQTPVVGDKLLPSLTLLRFVARDTSLRVEPRLDERYEAALGLALMRPGDLKDYQPAYAAYHLGLFVHDFVLAADSNIKMEGSNRYRPWAVDASHLIEALQTMQVLHVNEKAVAAVVKACVPALKNIEMNRPSTDTQRANLSRFKEPPQKELFKDRSDTAVKMPKAEFDK